MGKEKYVDNNLVKIRSRLNDSPGKENSFKESSGTADYKKNTPAPNSVKIHDKEWKKAVFKRWDEYNSLRRDVIVKIKETLDSIPDQRSALEKKMTYLDDAETRLKKVLSGLNELDDSGWDRHNLTQELASAMRKVENARMDCILASSKINDNKEQAVTQNSTASSSSFIHEITSLNFSQCFKLGLGFFFPLIIGIFIATLIFSIIYYISLN